jgi:tetratricopeptide (TPR) repeat protein
MREVLRRLICAASLATVVATGTAYAGNPLALPASSEARDHLNRGARLYNTRSFDEAIVEFKAGALIEPAPVFDYNLGQAYRQLGKYQDAIWHYERFLTYGNPTGDVLTAVQGFVAEMKEHLADRAHSMPPTGLATDAEPARPVAAPVVVKHDAPPRDESVNWIGWTTTGAGVAGIGVGAYLFVRASSLNDRANTQPDALMRNSLHDQASTRNLAGAIVGAAGVALTATGIYLLVARPHHTEQTASLDVGVTSHGVMVQGRF